MGKHAAEFCLPLLLVCDSEIYPSIRDILKTQRRDNCENMLNGPKSSLMELYNAWQLTEHSNITIKPPTMAKNVGFFQYPDFYEDLAPKKRKITSCILTDFNDVTNVDSVNPNNDNINDVNYGNINNDDVNNINNVNVNNFNSIKNVNHQPIIIPNSKSIVNYEKSPSSRVHHNQLEKQRRESMRGLYDQIKSLIPPNYKSDRTSTAKLLTNCADYLKNLHHYAVEGEHEAQALYDYKLKLIQELKDIREKKIAEIKKIQEEKMQAEVGTEKEKSTQNDENKIDNKTENIIQDTNLKDNSEHDHEEKEKSSSSSNETSSLEDGTRSS